MTEYYSLLARAVSRLENNNDNSREEIYERARVALLRQLRNGDPPFSDAEIEGEQFALEQAIAKLEAESPADLGNIHDRVPEEVA